MSVGDALLRSYERDVIDAAMAWAEEKMRGGGGPSSPATERLRTACYMLRRARGVTGKIRVVDSKKDDDPIG